MDIKKGLNIWCSIAYPPRGWVTPILFLIRDVKVVLYDLPVGL